MKVLVTTGLYPPEIGGPATYSRLLELELPKRGVAVEVLAYRSVRSWPNGIRQFIYFINTLRAAKGADCIYAMDTASVGFPSALAAMILKKKFLVRVPGDHAWEQGTQRFGVSGFLDDFPKWDSSWPLWLKIIRTAQLFVIRRAEKIVVPSEYLKKIVESWGVQKSKIVTIYNGVAVPDVGNRDVLRGLLNFNDTYIISVGRLVPWKGFDALIRVFSRLVKREKKLRLMIVGDGPEKSRLEKTVSDLKLGERVIFSGKLEHDVLLRYIKAADVFVLNTSYEGLSHLVLEAMSLGVPVVTTNVGGNPEVIRDNIDGYLVEPNDQSALQSRITTLLESESVRGRIVGAAHVRMSAFTDEATIEGNVRVLKAICGS